MLSSCSEYLDMQNYLNEHCTKGGAINNYNGALTMNASTLTNNTATAAFDNVSETCSM